MAIQFKQKCKRCFKNYVLASRRSRYIVCEECQKKEYSGEVTDPEMKELFDIPEEFYKENYFLRDIKAKYLRFGSLSEKQIEAFKKAAEELAEEKSKKQNKEVQTSSKNDKAQENSEK